MSRAATTLTKATLDRYGKAQTTLPEDLHYDADCLFKMFEKPKLMVRTRLSGCRVITHAHMQSLVLLA